MQLEFRAVSGPMAAAGATIEPLPGVCITTWQDWLATHPETTVTLRAKGRGGRNSEFLLALVFLPGQLVLGVLLLQLGLQVLDGETAGVELSLLGGGVDLHQQLAFLDRIADLDMDLADLPRRLSANVDIASRLQGAEGGDAAFDVAL